MIMNSLIFASSVGNPLNPQIIEDGFFISSASWMNFRLGYEGIFVADGRMSNTEKKKIDNFKFNLFDKPDPG